MPMQEAGRLLTIKLPAAQHKLIISQLNGCAGLSLTDQTSLTLLSDDAQLSAQDFLGRPVTACISVAGQAPQYINGLVNDFKRGHLDYDGKTHYEVELRPWLYFLTYCQDARTYQHQSIPDILHSLFKRRGFHAFDLSGLKGDYPVLDYCVQYNETDLDFVSRLMAEAGIYYYFEHTESDHKLMLCDTPEMLGRDQGSIPFDHHAKDAIQNWQYTEALCTKGASSLVYDYTRPKQLIRGEAGDTQDKASLFEDTHQATNNTELTDQMTRRLRRAQLDAHIAKGSSNIAHLRPGMRFNLTDHPIEKHNQAYVIETIHFEAEDHSYRGHHKAQDQDLQRYQNQLICHPGHLAYAPKQETKPRTTSLQSAVVTGSSNTEAYGDQYGRIKIQHHWDRHGQYNAHSSKWVRVRQMSAGKHWGTQFLPRAQEEVLVSYLNGDPNYPQVIGAVPNADHRPIFDIPKQESITGIKTHTLKNQDQTAGHQLTFDDKPQAEQLTIKSQRDLHIKTKNKSQKTIGNNSTTNIHAGDWQVNLDNGEYKLISQAQIQLVCGTSEILLTPNEITVQADQIGLNTTQVVPEVKLPSLSESTPEKVMHKLDSSNKDKKSEIYSFYIVNTAGMKWKLTDSSKWSNFLGDDDLTEGFEEQDISASSNIPSSLEGENEGISSSSLKAGMFDKSNELIESLTSVAYNETLIHSIKAKFTKIKEIYREKGVLLQANYWVGETASQSAPYLKNLYIVGPATNYNKMILKPMSSSDVASVPTNHVQKLEFLYVWATKEN